MNGGHARAATPLKRRFFFSCHYAVIYRRTPISMASPWPPFICSRRVGCCSCCCCCCCCCFVFFFVISFRDPSDEKHPAHTNFQQKKKQMTNKYWKWNQMSLKITYEPKDSNTRRRRKKRDRLLFCFVFFNRFATSGPEILWNQFLSSFFLDNCWTKGSKIHRGLWIGVIKNHS